MSIFLNNSEISAIKLGNNNVSKIFLGNEQVFPAPSPSPSPSPTPTPTLEVCPNSTSSVKMTGWVSGDRILAPIGYAPYGRETYTYGDEVVRYETGVWLYTNIAGEIVRAYSYAEWPWLADWPSPYAAEKVRQDGTPCESPISTPTPTPTPSPTPPAFGSSGFQWMTMNSITESTASGIGQNNITIDVTQTGGGMFTLNGMHAAYLFAPEYGIPLEGNQIANTQAGVFTAVFSSPITDALVAFASVGAGGSPVPVQVLDENGNPKPFTPIWDSNSTVAGTQTTYLNQVSPTQYTQFIGQEGFNIIRIDGTMTSVTFNYGAAEYYCTVCFGFVNQNTITPTPTPTPTPIPQGNSVSSVTPAGSNVTLNPFSQQETGTSLGLSVTFQEVTAQGTTTFTELFSAANPTSDFRGIQINTTASFVGDINLTFSLPNDISLSDFEKISAYSLIDGSNITVSRDYGSKTIQAKISYTQGQSLGIMAGGTTNQVILSQDDCDGRDAGVADPANRANKFHCYWKPDNLSIGGWPGHYEKCCRVAACLGDGNEFKNDAQCYCKCDVRQDVCNDFPNNTWTCVDCSNRNKVFYPSSCQCKCPSTCSSNQVQIDNCDCLCEPNYTPCGHTLITRINSFGNNYTNIDTKCCPPGQHCIPGPNGSPGTCTPCLNIGCITDGSCSISTTNYFVPNGPYYTSQINRVDSSGLVNPTYGTGTWKSGWRESSIACGFLYTYSTKSGCVFDRSWGSCRRWRRGSRVYLYDCETKTLTDVTDLALDNAQEKVEVQECWATLDNDSDCTAEDPPVMVPPTLSCNP